MKTKLLTLTLLFITFTKAFAETKNFTGHIQYAITYSKEYITGSWPKHFKLDAYITDKRKVFVVQMSTGKRRLQDSTYIFDDEKKILTILNTETKNFSETQYAVVPEITLVVQPENKTDKVIEFSKRPVKPINYLNTTNKMNSKSWYSSLTTLPFKHYFFESQFLIEPKTGRIALVGSREVAKDLQEFYVGKIISTKIPAHIYKVPKTYTKKKIL